MYDQEREEVLSYLPQEDLPDGGPFPNCNAYVCVSNGVVQVYLKDGGWLGMKIDDVRADAAPWAD